MHNDVAKKVMFSKEEKRFYIRKREIPGCTGEFRALFITDTHSHMTKQALDDSDSIFYYYQNSCFSNSIIQIFHDTHFSEITITTDS